MLKTANASFMLGTSSWREQFIDALTVSAGDDDDDEEEVEVEGEEKEPAEGDVLKGGGGGGAKQPKEPSKSDYFMHFLSVPWKLAFATIPPTGEQALNVIAH
jgi:solute carrier family 8 (sodium/calcium exchanger)